MRRSCQSLFVNLTRRKNVANVECVTAARGLTETSAGHTFNVISRDRSQALRNLEGWKSAFIIDAHQGRSFFYQFVNEIAANTCLKALNSCMLVCEFSSVDISIPDILPNSKAYYQQQLTIQKQRCLELYEQCLAAKDERYGLEFRQAANDGNTETMLQLKSQWTRLDVNSSGNKSKQTAAHRAASQGHVAVLRLLYSLGANFNLADNDGHEAQDYAKTAETNDFFATLEIAK